MTTRVSSARAIRSTTDGDLARWSTVGLLALVWVTMAVLVDPVGDFAINDDWVYAIAVRSVLSGHLEIPSFSTATVGPQAYWGALFCLPFGFSYTALRVSTLVLGLVGVVAIHAVVLNVWKDKTIALVAALAMAVNPIYFSLSNTFMTDVPFMALVASSIFFILRGMEHDQPGATTSVSTGIGLGLALLDVLLRQVGLVVLAGYFVARIVKDGFAPRNLARAAWPAVVGVALHLGFSEWLLATGRKPYSSGIAVVAPQSIVDFVRTSLHETFVALLYLGLFVGPLIVLVVFTRRSRRSLRFGTIGLVLAIACAFAALLLVRRETMPLGGNVLAYFGIGPLAQHDTLLLNQNLPPTTLATTAFWFVTTAAAVLGAAVLSLAMLVGAARTWAEMRRGGRSFASQWKAAFLTTIAASYAVLLFVVANHNNLFDRYLLPFVVLAALAVPVWRSDVRDSRRSAGIVASGVTLLMAATFSTVATHDYLAWNRARSIAYRHLVDVEKIDPRRIDGGYEYTGADLYSDSYRATPGKSWWYVVDDEYMLASGGLAGYVETARTGVDRWWRGGGGDVLTLRRAGDVAR